MKFNFPDFEDLTEEQKNIWALSSSGKYLITGAPGTGKTVMSVWRLIKLYKDFEGDLKFITYGKMLNNYTKEVLSNLDDSKEFDGIENSIETYYSFVNDWHKELFDTPAPKENTNERFPPFDFNAITDNLKQKYTLKNIPKANFLVDEGQDLPPEFYQWIVGVTANNFTVCADEDQTIYPNQSSLSQIKNKAILNDNQSYNLTHNFRNNIHLGRALLKFHDLIAGDPTKKPSIDEHEGIKPVIKKSSKSEDIDEIINLSKNTNDVIGVILSSKYDVKRWYQNIKKQRGSTGSNKYYVGAYWNTNGGTDQDIRNARDTINNLDKVKILITTVHSAKGLEFDHVFIPNIDSSYLWKDMDLENRANLRLFYVAMSRPKNGLKVTYYKEKNNLVKKLYEIFGNNGSGSSGFDDLTNENNSSNENLQEESEGQQFYVFNNKSISNKTFSVGSLFSLDNDQIDINDSQLKETNFFKVQSLESDVTGDYLVTARCFVCSSMNEPEDYSNCIHEDEEIFDERSLIDYKCKYTL